MAKSKLFLVKGERRYQVLKLDKLTGEVKLRGELKDFVSNIHKALAAGYVVVRERQVSRSDDVAGRGAQGQKSESDDIERVDRGWQNENVESRR